MHKIGIISDTHNLLREPVAEILRTCDVILHGGDINSLQILNQLKSIAPLYAVRGNTDRELADALPLSLSVELFGIKIFMIHNKKMIHGDIQDRDLIIYGHSHKYEHLQKDGQTWLNPGSCGRRRFSLPITMAVISIPDLSDTQPKPEPFQNTQTQAAQSAVQPFHSAMYQIEQIQFNADGTPADKSTDYAMPSAADMKQIVIRVMRETDKGKSVQDIAKSCHISEELSTQICRLYLTHPGVTPDGILGKMGI